MQFQRVGKLLKGYWRSDLVGAIFVIKISVKNNSIIIKEVIDLESEVNITGGRRVSFMEGLHSSGHKVGLVLLISNVVTIPVN